MNVVVVGGGAMGQSIARGLLVARGFVCAVVEKDSVNAHASEALGATVFSSLADIDPSSPWANPDACVIAVKPQDIDSLSEDLTTRFPSSTLVLSIAAGVSIDRLQEIFPQFPVVRAMPNIAASEFLSATAMCSADKVSEKNEHDARAILETLGDVVRVDESKMNVVTAISGSGPAYFFYLAELIADQAEKNGLDREVAHALLAQTFLGAATLAKENGSFATLRERVTSKGGTTQAALDAFNENGFIKAVEKGISAAISRASQLNEGNSRPDGKKAL